MLAIALTSMLASTSSACRTIEPSTPRFENPEAEVWIIESRSLFGRGLFPLTADIYYCRQVEGGASDCREAEMINTSIWFPTRN